MANVRPERDWLDSVRTQVLRGELASAQRALAQALAEYPTSMDLRRAQAGIFRQTGQPAAAEKTLRELLAQRPGDIGSAFALATLLKERWRTADATTVLRTCLATEPNGNDPELAISAVELLDEMKRKRDAAAVAQAAIAEHPDDARLHAYAGMLAMQLGEFECAREHYLFALRHDPRALEWHAAIGLSSAQRYEKAEHPDFVLFREGLKRSDLSELARAELHFSLGKASDDIGDYAQAAERFREGNAIRKRGTSWSRKAWRRTVEARLAAKPGPIALEPMEDVVPVFIVGMPRSGTTLLAELLSRHPRVRNRGELDALARLARQPALCATPTRSALHDAAADYAQQARQDDAPESRWFIDKQPLNFRYIDLALALFPDARIIHCQRSPRDTGLSLWMQCFLEDVQGYAYDFGDIALVMRDCDRLMAHWADRYPDSIRTVRYETLVENSLGVTPALAEWIGLQPLSSGTSASAPQAGSTISTASVWQARQPINTRSIGRWKKYAEYVPEILDVPEP